MQGRQSVRKKIWHIGGKYKRARRRRRKQKGGAIPFGPLASLGALILGEIAKLILEKILQRGLRKRRKISRY